MSYLSGTLHGAGFGHLFKLQRWSDDPIAFESITAKARECVMECFDLIEEELNAKEGVWAIREEMFAMDPYLFVFWR